MFTLPMVVCLQYYLGQSQLLILTQRVPFNFANDTNLDSLGRLIIDQESTYYQLLFFCCHSSEKEK